MMLLNMYGATTPLEGRIDLQYLNPKIIGKIVWMYKNNELFTDLTDDQYNNWKVRVRHNYLAPLRDYEDRYLYHLGIDPQTVTAPSPKPSGARLMEKLAIEMRKFATATQRVKHGVERHNGWEQYILACATARPDAMGQALNIRGRMDTNPCVAPVMVCGVCSAPNLMSHHDSPCVYLPQSWVKDYAKQHLLPENTWDDSELHNYDLQTPVHTPVIRSTKQKLTVTEEEEVAWRCGACFADLGILVIDQWITFDLVLQAISDPDPPVMGLLEYLKLMRYGDFIDEISKQEGETIMKHDRTIVKRALRDASTKLITVGPDVPPELFTELNRLYVKCVARPLACKTSMSPQLATELAYADSWVSAKLNSTDQLLKIGSLSWEYRPGNHHHWNYNPILMGQYIGEGLCFTTGPCEHKLHCPAVFGMGALNDTLTNFMSAVKNQSDAYLILLNPGQKLLGPLTSNLGYIKDNGECLEIYIDGTMYPLVVNKELYEVLINSDAIVDGNDCYSLLTVKKGIDVVIKHIMGPVNQESIGKLVNVSTPTKKKIVMPVPDTTGVMGLWTALAYKDLEIDFEPGLFRELCIRNFTGKCGRDDLMSYGMGYALTRFTVHNTVIHNPQVCASQIQIHVFLCQVTMGVANSRAAINNQALTLLSKLGPLKSIVTGHLESLDDAVRTGIKWLAESKFSLDFENIMNTLTEVQINEWVSGITKTHIWEDLLDIVNSYPVGDVKVHVMHKPSALRTLPSHRCHHHSWGCDHTSINTSELCECCGMPTPEEGYCICCMPKPDLEHEYGIDLFNVVDPKSRVKEVSDVITKEVKTSRVDKSNSESLMAAFIKQISRIGLKDRDEKEKTPRIDLSKTPRLTAVNSTQAKSTKRKGKTAAKPDETDLRPSSTTPAPPTADVLDEVPGTQVCDATDVTNNAGEFVTDDVEGQSIDQEELERKIAVAEELKRLYRSRTHNHQEKVAATHLTENKVNTLNPSYDYSDYFNLLGAEFATYLLDREQSLIDLQAAKTKPYEVIIPYVPIGIHNHTDQWMEVLSRINVSNTYDNSCGLDAYNYVTGRGLSREEILSLIGVDNNLLTTDLANLADACGDNLILITELSVITCKYSESDVFPVIVLDSTSPDNGHYSPAIVLLRNDPGFYAIRAGPSLESFRTDILTLKGLNQGCLFGRTPITAQDNLIIELTTKQCSDDLDNAVISIRTPEVRRIGDGYYFTNSPGGIHKPGHHLYHKPIRESILNVIEAMSTTEPNMALKSNLLNTIFNREPRIADNLVQEYDHKVREAVKSVIDLQVAFGDGRMPSKVKSWHKVECKASGKWTSIINPCPKLKTLDWVYITNKSGSYLRQVVIDRTRLLVASLGRQCDGSKLGVLDTSVASAIKCIATYCSTVPDGKKIRELLANAIVIDGVAGHGKSNAIAQECNTSDLVIAKTHLAVAGLRAKITKRVNVLSIERAVGDPPHHYTRIIIDEASMVDYIEICPLISAEVTELKLYGDSRQIGNRDFSSSGGVRHTLNLMDLAGSAHVSKENQSYRIGYPAAEYVQQLYPEFTGTTEHNTGFQIVHVNPDNVEKLRDDILMAKFDVVITFYNHTKILLEKLLPKEVPVVTAHSYQGREANRVAVVQWPDANGNMTLCRHMNYMYTAVTRGISQTTLYTSLNVDDNPSLSQLVTMGGQGHTRYQPPTTTDKYLTRLDKISLRNSHLWEDDLIQALQGNKDKDGKSITVKRTDTATIISVMDGKNKKIGYFVNEGGNLTANFGFGLANMVAMSKVDDLVVDVKDGGVYNRDTKTHIAGPLAKDKTNLEHLYVEEMLYPVEHRPPLNKIMDHVACPNSMWKTVLVPTVQQMCKIRMATYMCDCSLPNHSITYTTPDGPITMSKTEGCPLACGLKLEFKGSVVNISSQYRNWWTRSISVTGRWGQNGRQLLTAVGKWLGVKIPKDLTDNCHELSIPVYPSTAISARLYAERMSHGIFGIANLLNMHKVTADCADGEAVQTAERITSHYKLHSGNIKVRSPHKTWLVHHKKRGWIRNYDVISIGPACRPWIERQSISVELMSYLVEMIEKDLAGKVEKPEFDAVGSFDLEGMILDVNYHITNDTSVGKELKRSAGHISQYTTVKPKEHLVISEVGMRELRSELKDAFPLMHVNPHSHAISGSYVEECLDSLAINIVGETFETCDLSYVGKMPHIPYVLNKHYVKLITPASHYTHYHEWHESLNLAKTLHHNYREAMHASEPDMTVKPFGTIQPPDSGTIIVAGTSLHAIPYHDLRSWMAEGKRVFGWVPDFTNGSERFYTPEKTSTGANITYHLGHKPSAVDRKLLEMCNMGRPIIQDNEPSIICRHIKSVLGHKLVEVILSTKERFNVQLESMVMSGTKVNVDLPFINLDPVQLLSGGPVVQVKRYTICKKLLRLLQLRMAQPGCKTTDVLSYARSLASACEITDRSIRYTHDVDLKCLHHTAYLAVYLQGHMKERYHWLSSVWDLLRKNDGIAANAQVILGGFAKICSMFSDAVSEFLQPELLNTILNNKKLGITNAELKRLEGELQAKLNWQNRYWVQYTNHHVSRNPSTTQTNHGLESEDGGEDWWNNERDDNYFTTVAEDDELYNLQSHTQVESKLHGHINKELLVNSPNQYAKETVPTATCEFGKQHQPVIDSCVELTTQNQLVDLGQSPSIEIVVRELGSPRAVMESYGQIQTDTCSPPTKLRTEVAVKSQQLEPGVQTRSDTTPNDIPYKPPGGHDTIPPQNTSPSNQKLKSGTTELTENPPNMDGTKEIFDDADEFHDAKESISDLDSRYEDYLYNLLGESNTEERQDLKNRFWFDKKLRGYFISQERLNQYSTDPDQQAELSGFIDKGLDLSRSDAGDQVDRYAVITTSLFEDPGVLPTDSTHDTQSSSVESTQELVTALEESPADTCIPSRPDDINIQIVEPAATPHADPCELSPKLDTPPSTQSVEVGLSSQDTMTHEETLTSLTNTIDTTNQSDDTGTPFKTRLSMIPIPRKKPPTHSTPTRPWDRTTQTEPGPTPHVQNRKTPSPVSSKHMKYDHLDTNFHGAEISHASNLQNMIRDIDRLSIMEVSDTTESGTPPAHDDIAKESIEHATDQEYVWLISVGSSGDIVAMDPVAESLMPDYKVVVATHFDLMHCVPEGQGKVMLPISSKVVMKAVVDNLTKGMIHMFSTGPKTIKLMAEVIEPLFNIKPNVSLIVSNHFTPLVGLLAAHWGCKLVHAYAFDPDCVDSFALHPKINSAPMVKEMINPIKATILRALDFSMANQLNINCPNPIDIAATPKLITSSELMASDESTNKWGKLYIGSTARTGCVAGNSAETMKFVSTGSITLITWGSVYSEYNQSILQDLVVHTINSGSKVLFNNYKKLYTLDKVKVVTLCKPNSCAMDRLLIVESLDYNLVLPRCKAIVHHGGSGTTHQAVSYDVPSLILPIFGDQFWWSKRVNDLRIGIGLEAESPITVVNKAVTRLLTRNQDYRKAIISSKLNLLFNREMCRHLLLSYMAGQAIIESPDTAFPEVPMRFANQVEMLQQLWGNSAGLSVIPVGVDKFFGSYETETWEGSISDIHYKRKFSKSRPRVLVCGWGTSGEFNVGMTYCKALKELGLVPILLTNCDQVSRIPEWVEYSCVPITSRVCTVLQLESLRLDTMDNKAMVDQLKTYAAYDLLHSRPIKLIAVIGQEWFHTASIIAKAYNARMLYLSPHPYNLKNSPRPNGKPIDSKIHNASMAPGGKWKLYFGPGKALERMGFDPNLCVLECEPSDTDVIISMHPDFVAGLVKEDEPRRHYVGHIGSTTWPDNEDPSLSKFILSNRNNICLVTASSCGSESTLNPFLTAIMYLVNNAHYVVVSGSFIKTLHPKSIKVGGKMVELKPGQCHKQVFCTPALDLPRWAGYLYLAVHHGGTGTMLECIRGKVPCLSWPIAFDQYLNARMTEYHQLTVGPCTPEEQERGIQVYLDELLRKRRAIKMNLEGMHHVGRCNSAVLTETLAGLLNVFRNQPMWTHHSGHDVGVGLRGGAVMLPIGNFIDLASGVYTVKLELETEYSPPGIGYCTWNCYNRYMQNVCCNWELLEPRYSDEYRKQSLSTVEVIKLGVQLGINVILSDINSKTSIYYHLFPGNNTIHLGLENQTLMKHCILLKVPIEPPELGSRVELSQQKENNWNIAITGLIETGKIRCSREQVNSAMECVRDDMEACFTDSNNLITRAALIQLHHIMEVQKNPILVDDFAFSTDGSASCAGRYSQWHNTLVLSPCIGGWGVGVCLYHSGRLTIKLFDGHIMTSGVALSLRASCFKLYEARCQVTITQQGELLLALNQQTMKYTTSEVNCVKPSRVVGAQDDDYSLVIRHYDNRKHHLYDEASYIERAVSVRWLGEPINETKFCDMTRSHNRAVDRVIYDHGQLLRCMESSNKFWLLAAAGALVERGQSYKIVGTSIVYRCKFRESNIFDVMKKYTYNWLDEDASDNKIATPLKWDVRWPLKNSDVASIFFIDLPTATAWITYLTGGRADEVRLAEAIITTPVPACEIRTADDRDGWLLTHAAGSPALLTLRYGCYLVEAMAGGDTTGGSYSGAVWQEMKSNKHVSGDWFHIKPANEADPKHRKAAREVAKLTTAMMMLEIESLEHYTTTSISGVYEPEYLKYIEPMHDIGFLSELEPLADYTPLHVLKLWDIENDLTDWLQIYAPQNVGSFITKEKPQRLIECQKTTLTRYPLLSRPVLTKVAFEETRTVAGRMFSIQHIRKGTIPTAKMVNDICRAYFRPDWQELCNKFKADPIVYDPASIENWIMERKGAPEIIKELMTKLAGELMTKPISDVNIHLKLESLLKESPIVSWKQQQSRPIVWQPKAIAAIFSAVFIKAKDRLKELLSDKVVYADGHTPASLSARVRNVKGTKWFYENDLTKQDRQTDEEILKVEMAMYELLGVHPLVISAWYSVHRHWRMKGTYTRSKRDFMRMTGQATTALGNVITNFQVHCRFVLRNQHRILFMLFLGDDMLMFFSEKPDIKGLRNEIAVYFNMQSKDSINELYGTFCGMLAYHTSETTCELGPDFMRLKYRFEVTNGVHEDSDLNMRMRTMSYCMMLGDISEVRHVIDSTGLPIQPVSWYSKPHAMQAAAHKHNSTPIQIGGVLHSLCQMMKDAKTFHTTFKMYTSKPRW
ncbi:hypothetical protein [Shahe endorna-like virus 1]|uniref:hypothetical protein n=1 Tax=Shahe endorna-like virus 1 TaxID=1923414 RepID=UPI000909F8FA|nr:hypothetical protein [Shahe endorna-like virus 1]APG77709.1 hypothetical protein [Shahe endorna-like virus 1]